MVADGMAFAVDNISETIEPVIAENSVRKLEITAGI